MFKWLVAVVLLATVLLSAGGTAFALEADEAVRSRSVFYVNGVRAPFRALNIAGQEFVDIFEIANTLSRTEARFSPRWIVRNHKLSIVSGREAPFIGTNLSLLTPTVSKASFANIDVIFEGRRFNMTAYSVSNSIYFNLQQVAALLDVGIECSDAGNAIHLTTEITFTESLDEIRSINPFRPMIALTFDDGPSVNTIPILDALEYHGVVATFYVTANRLENYMDIASRTHMLGNEIANHSWSHPRFTLLSEEEIYAELHYSNAAISQITGMAPASFRPPFGLYDDRVSRIAAELGLPLLLWSLDTNDWYTRDADATFNIVMDNVRDRDIILMHDLHEPTARAAIRLIPALIERGFQLVTVSELFYHSNITPTPGRTYESGHG